MASSKIVKYTSEELEEKRRRGESKTDWERVRKMKLEAKRKGVSLNQLILQRIA